MVNYEKTLPLAQPAGSGNHGAPKRSRRPGLWAALFLGTLAFYGLSRPAGNWKSGCGLSRSQPAVIEPQCPQVEPLRPKRQTDALEKMEKYIESAEFQKESIARVSGAIQVPSESYDDLGPVGEDKRWETFYDLARYLEKTFPKVHDKLQLDKINTHGLLYTWEGSDKKLKPTVLMAHQDVVPVPAATVDDWTHPPYSGHFDGKFIWGRGSMDCKNLLIGILEAVELLLEADFKPSRTLVLSFGFDEESSGGQGAGHLAPVLLERYGKDGAAIIVDEGNGIAEMFGALLATPAVAEKGYIDVEVVVRMPGGHSSVPPPHNAIGVMSEFITSVEANRYEPELHDENPFGGLLQCGAAHAPDFPPKWKKLLGTDKLLKEIAETNVFYKYLFTTSVAVDVINGGVKANALPERVSALINHRVNVGDATAVVQDRLTKLASAVADKYNLTLNAFTEKGEVPLSISLKTVNPLEPAPVTPTNVDTLTPYAVLSGTTRALYDREVIMAPGLSTGNTDTRFYWDLSRHIFRYQGAWDPEQSDLGGIHTVNERLTVSTHINTIRWISTLIRNMDEADLA